MDIVEKLTSAYVRDNSTGADHIRDCLREIVRLRYTLRSVKAYLDSVEDKEEGGAVFDTAAQAVREELGESA